MANPLRIEYETASVIDSSVIELEVACTSGWAWRSPFSVPRLVASFEAVGHAGGLAGSRYAPENSVIAREGDCHLDDARGRWRFRTARLAPGAIEVLSRVLEFSHRTVRPLTSVVVRGAPALLNPLADLAGHSQLPFECEVAPGSLSVYVQVQFASAQGVAVAARVERLVAAWVWLAGSGGFERGGRAPLAPLLVPEKLPAVNEDVLETRVDKAAFDDAAFDSLLNMFRGIHAAYAPILSVEIA